MPLNFSPFWFVPKSHQDVTLATSAEISLINGAISQGLVKTNAGKSVTQSIEGALVRADHAIAYPIRDDIPVMLVSEGLIIFSSESLRRHRNKFPWPNSRAKSWSVLLTNAPTHPNFRPAIALMQAAIDSGLRVYLYCIDEGVRAVASPEVQALKTRGVNLFGCAYGAGRRKIPVDDSAAWSGLTVLADVISGSTDRFVSFLAPFRHVIAQDPRHY